MEIIGRTLYIKSGTLENTNLDTIIAPTSESSVEGVLVFDENSKLVLIIPRDIFEKLSGTSGEFPFSAEPLSVTLSVYKAPSTLQ